jgi:tetratricopeptide (TPR) repeat protein
MHIELGMHAPGVRVTLATIISNKGNDEEARQQLLEALKDNQAKKDNRGIEICQKRLAQLSGKLPSTGRSLSSKDLFVHAVTLRHKNKHLEAMKLIDQAVELAQIENDEFTEARARGAIGINAFKEKIYGKAETYLQKAVEMHFKIGSTNIGECRYFLALTYEKLNKPKEALNIIKESMDGVLRDEERLKWESLLLRIEKMKVFTV